YFPIQDKKDQSNIDPIFVTNLLQDLTVFYEEAFNHQNNDITVLKELVSESMEIVSHVSKDLFEIYEDSVENNEGSDFSQSYYKKMMAYMQPSNEQLKDYGQRLQEINGQLIGVCQ